MKRFFTILSMVVLLVAVSTVVYASEPCSDVTAINVTFETIGQRIAKIQNVFSNFVNQPEKYFSEERNSFEICFQMNELTLSSFWVNQAPEFNGSFLLSVGAEGEHDVLVRGLNIARADDLLFDDAFLRVQHNGQGRVILDDIHLGNVKNGLSLEGSGLYDVTNSVITGDSGESGSCLAIMSDKATVKKSDISNCAADGIRIEANDALIGAMDRTNYEAEKNLIHHNGIGIHVVSGDRNRFGYNSVYENGIQGQATADNGITIEEEANEGFARPAVVMDEESGLPLRCTKNEEGVITKREIWFTVPGAGEIEIYNSDDGDFEQGISLVAACGVQADGKCLIENPVLPVELADMQCGFPDYYVTAMLIEISTPTKGGKVKMPPRDIEDITEFPM